MQGFIQFEPIYQTRVWGGRTLESRFGRVLPDDQPYGESWEVSAREEANSVVSNGPLAGRKLTELWSDPELKKEIFGPEAPEEDRFPLLCKILDARDKLSIQVHPPAAIAPQLGGEPKTEIWYIADADEGAELYVGVKSGVDADAFQEAMDQGTVEQVVHTLYPVTGDYIFIESGRLHAIGAGLLIYEIQQNSDTTYRVFDWNRKGLDGKPRELHLTESMMCIDFDDVEPDLDSSNSELLCTCDYFRLEKHEVTDAASFGAVLAGRFAIVTVVEGEVGFPDGGKAGEGDFFIVSHGADCGELSVSGGSSVLVTTWP